MNIINILNSQCIQRSVELPYRGDAPVLNPGSLLDILITELPTLFKDILNNLGFDVSNWPDSFHMSDNSEDPLLTIIYPSLTGKGRTIDDILAHTKGPVLILDPNPIYSPSLGQGRKIVGISMADLAIEILRRIGSYSVTSSVMERIEELCKIWITLGTIYQTVNFNKPFLYSREISAIRLPGTIHSSYDIFRYILIRRMESMLLLQLEPYINSGIVSVTKTNIRPKEARAKMLKDFEVIISRFPYLTIIKKNEDIEIQIGWRSLRNIYLYTEIETQDNILHQRLKNSLLGWETNQYNWNNKTTYTYSKKKDVSNRTIQDVLDEIVTDICDVVTGKTVY